MAQVVKKTRHEDVKSKTYFSNFFEGLFFRDFIKI